MTEHVVLVDEQDQAIGEKEKMEAHVQGVLHRAFSIFIFNDQKKLLLHQRAASKYHSGGLWTNTCCSHPRPGETMEKAAHRRLMEEMGFDCELREIFVFQYQAELDQGLIEHEVDHVLFGEFNGEPMPDPDEVADYAWIGLEDVTEEIQKHPEKFSAWFKIAVGRVIEYIG